MDIVRKVLVITNLPVGEAAFAAANKDAALEFTGEFEVSCTFGTVSVSEFDFTDCSCSPKQTTKQIMF